VLRDLITSLQKKKCSVKTVQGLTFHLSANFDTEFAVIPNSPFFCLFSYVISVFSCLLYNRRWVYGIVCVHMCIT
jgi:hypothetical protein